MRIERDRVPFLVAAAALFSIVAGLPSLPDAEARPKKGHDERRDEAARDEAARDEAPSKKGKGKGRCQPQRPQAFLVRSSFVVNNRILPRPLARAIRYRTEQYGYVEGFGDPKWNDHEPAYYAESTTFFGHALSMHRRVVPALRCVEEELPRACSKTPYAPASVGGFRDRNTYRGGEVTNHLYGIAIDIDPERNPCCHCVEPWGSHPMCQGEGKSVYERMAMPACWVKTFEKYGFYWLGHDRLQDTMHFEFLGKPEKILR